jgi:hypothetical protein
MNPLPRLRSLFRNLFRKERVERDLDADVAAYLDQLTDEKVAAGMRPEEARREARIELGGVEQVKEEVRGRPGRPAPGIVTATASYCAPTSAPRGCPR